jgi:TonB-linked SusC/RagA family outer membrane protein
MKNKSIKQFGILPENAAGKIFRIFSLIMPLVAVFLCNTAISLGNGPDITSAGTVQQKARIRGVITDKSGNPLPGVNIQIEGTTIGSISDAEGKYQIDVQSRDNVLIFSFIGYNSQKVRVGNNNVIDVNLEENLSALDEVIVVGYGTQKKVNVTGSVANVTSEALETKNVARGSLALVGEMSGISVRQLSGNPRENAAQISIRGLGTFSSAGNNPLVLVDGIESSLDNVDPNDIKSVSVLKDAASASIYGSKAANGVILVETKKGISGAPKFSVYSYVGKQQATEYPQELNSWDYAAAVNEFMINSGQSARFTEDDIQKFRTGTDPAYPNFNHMKYLWTSGSGLQTKQGISMSGGTQSTRYLFSAGYLNQDGIVMKNYTKRYDVRLNIDTRLTDKVNLNVNMSGNTYKGNEPSAAYDKGIPSITRGALRLSNNLPGPMDGGYWGNNETLHPEADLNSPSFLGNNSTYVAGNADLEWNIIKDLKISGKAGYTYNTGQEKWFRATYPVTPTYSVTPNNLTDSWSNNTLLTLQALADYSKSFGDHFIHLLGGFSQQQYSNSYINAFRDALPNNELSEIDAGSVTNAKNGGGAAGNKLRSFFGRINYSFLEKYLIETNIRYDGSSRFPQDRRYGLFPSFSAGWRVSKENFFENILPVVSDLKLRASWGELGNQSVGNYPYQALISLGQNYPFGTTLTPGAAITTLPNRNITWERTRMTDGGIDITMLSGKLSMTVDHFIKTTTGILYQVSASSMLGANPSPENAGTVENKGWDFDISHKNNVGDFSFGISANLSLNSNKVTKLANVKLDIAKGLFLGYPIGSGYGYVADGLFVNAEDVSNYPAQPTVAHPGDIRYKDLSGPDGVPDGKVDATYDRTVIGSPIPTSTYGLNLTARYKGFDLDVLFQGEGGREIMIKAWHFFAYDNNGNIQQWQYDQRWTPENPDRNAGYPAFSVRANDYYSTNPSSYWFKNATFLRLKNVQVGYNVPKKLTGKLSLDNLRVYVNGENLFTVSQFYKGWDPEMSVSDQYGWYPLTRLLLAGIKIDF